MATRSPRKRPLTETEKALGKIYVPGGSVIGGLGKIGAVFAKKYAERKHKANIEKIKKILNQDPKKQEIKRVFRSHRSDHLLKAIDALAGKSDKKKKGK